MSAPRAVASEPAGEFLNGGYEKPARDYYSRGLSLIIPAASYSPTQSPAQYHRLQAGVPSDASSLGWKWPNFRVRDGNGLGRRRTRRVAGSAAAIRKAVTIMQLDTFKPLEHNCMMQVRRATPYLLLLLWTTILYFSALSNPFVYDDQSQIAKNPDINSLRTVLVYFRQPSAFDQAFAPQPGSFYRPFFWLSLTIDNKISRRSPEFFHATNLLIHALNGILIFLIFRRWFTGLLPLMAGLAWLSLPIHTEVVAWISGRAISLATFFVLLDVFCALKYAERRSWRYLVLMTLASCAALLSHEAGIVGPPMAILTILWRSQAALRWRSTINVIVAVMIPVAAYTVLRAAVFKEPPVSFQPLTEILLRGPVSVAKYIWWTIHAPAMSMERSTELIDLTFRSWTYFAAWLTIAGLAVTAIWLRSSLPLFAAGLLGAAIALAPFAQVLKLYQSVAERYTYTASIGIVLAIVAILAAVISKLRWPAWSAVVVLAVWMALSFMPLRERIHAWSSESELYHTSLIASPKSAVLYLNLGVLNDEAGYARIASGFYEDAIALQPSYLQAHINLANAYMKTGRLDDAATEYKQVLAYDPGNLGAQLKLAQLLAMKGDYDSALSLLMRLVKEHPDSSEAETDLGIVLYQKKDPAARDHFEKALQIKPDSMNAAYNLAILEEDSGHTDAARKLYQQVLRYHPDDLEAAQALKRLR
jgi:tetratricopeptide (TPR) repeat protein